VSKQSRHRPYSSLNRTCATNAYGSPTALRIICNEVYVNLWLNYRKGFQQSVSKCIPGIALPFAPTIQPLEQWYYVKKVDTMKKRILVPARRRLYMEPLWAWFSAIRRCLIKQHRVANQPIMPTTPC